MIKLLIVFCIGSVFGAVIMSCCAAAGRADKDIEENSKSDETDIS